MGGSGKTRLAIEVATHLVDAYADGVWLVALETVQNPSHVPRAVATILNVREEAGRTLTQTLITHIAQQRMLLILDNCEHLIEAVSALAYALLQACPNLKILTTSRQVLGLLGEATQIVPPLALPPLSITPSETVPAPPSDVESFEAVQLFLDPGAISAC